MPDTEVTQWRVVAWFDTVDQAKAAAAAIHSTMPRAYEFSALTREGTALWREEGKQYGVRDVRV